MKIPKKLIAIIAICVAVALIAMLSFGCKKEEKAGGEFRAFLVEPVSLDPLQELSSSRISLPISISHQNDEKHSLIHTRHLIPAWERQ